MTAAIIDYHDSFTYNIEHILKACDIDVDVINDECVVLEDLSNYDMIILSPGPGLPSETRSMSQILKKYAFIKPILGICLGMQGITEYFGGELYNQQKVKHGVQVKVSISKDDPLFSGISNEFQVGLYHSWACKINDQTGLIKLMESQDNVLMAIKHNDHVLYGLQFHPESVLTEFGEQLLRNFVVLALQTKSK